MQLQLVKVMPQYLTPGNHTEIWGKEIEVRPSEHLHVVAPSGSGKTSLVHFIYGMRNDFSGQILINGKDIRSFSKEEKATLRKDKVSIIFQDLRLFPEQTALENILIKNKLTAFYQEEMIYSMAARLGIEQKMQQCIKTCSYGEQQRVAIIRALVQPFELLLLDEPFSHLDEVNRSRAMDLLYEECEKRKASLLFADLKKLDFLKNEASLNL